MNGECSILLNLYTTQTDQVAKHRKMDRIRVSIRKYKKKRVKKRKKNLSQQFVKKEIAIFAFVLVKKFVFVWFIF